MPVANRSFATGSFLLNLDGKTVGIIRSFSGGNAVGDVITARSGADRLPKKMIGSVRYEPVEIEIGAGLDPAVYQWITATLDGTGPRKSGSVVSLDANLKPLSELQFDNALISEVAFPSADASSKGFATITIKFEPEQIRYVRKPAGSINVPVGKKTKNWAPANFRLGIEGLAETCKRVSKIEAFTVKQTLVERFDGTRRTRELTAASVDAPNLVISLAETHAAEITDWADDFLIKGNNAGNREKKGTLEFLAPDLQEVLMTVSFKSLGIFRLAPVKSDASSEAIRRVRADLYCEQVGFSVP